ncbi:unnamed protein product [Effrenium voratum]|nr:unnamed protein product [Effrenium voratum]CAJ1436062.1 unnamed protein product [Effrenium voratum]
MARPRMSLSHFLGIYFGRRIEWSGLLTVEYKRRLALLCGQAGYLTGLFEYVMTDMLWLRFFACGGCALIVGFQALQPKYQWVSLGWNSVYCAVNLYHIRLLLLKQPRQLVEDELQLHKVLGEQVPREQILSLLEVGEWRRFIPGGTLVEEGCTEKDAQVYILVRGCCDVQIRGLKVGRLCAGATVGAELPALRLLCRPETTGQAGGATLARATVTAADSEVLCLQLPWSWLKSERPYLEVLQRGFATSLAAQVAAGDAVARLLEYGAVLEMACYSSTSAATSEARVAKGRRTLSRIYPPVAGTAMLSLTEPMLGEAVERRRQHLGISEEEHFMVVETLPEECHRSKLLGGVPSMAE